MLLVDYGEDLQAYTVLDGVMGLGSMESKRDFIDLAYEAGHIEEKIFSFYLDHNPDNSGASISRSSYLSIGFIPEQYSNKVSWVPVTSPTRWVTDLIAIDIGDEKYDLGSDTQAKQFLIDTGCSFLVLQPSVISVLEQHLKKFHFIQNEGYRWPCEEEDLKKYPNLTFTTRGIKFNITARSYFYLSSEKVIDNKKYCQPAILSSKLTGGLQILGDSFFRESFVAFSKRNQTMGIYVPDMILLNAIPMNQINLLTGIIGLIMILFFYLYLWIKQGRYDLDQTEPTKTTTNQTENPPSKSLNEGL